MAYSLDNVAGTGLTFGTNHRRTLANAAQRLSEVTRSTHEWHGEQVLVDMIMLIGGGQHLGLVNAVYADGLENLGLDKMPDTALCHHWNGHGLFNLNDQFRVAHTGNAAMCADIGWHALKGHNGAGSSLFRDTSLFRVHYIADNSTFEHLRESTLDFYCSCLLLHDDLSPDT